MLHSPEGALSPVPRPRTLGVVVAAVLLAGCGGYSSSTSPPPPPNPTPPPAGSVSINVDAANRHQVIEGFGASTEQWSDCGNDQMGASRQAILDAIYKQVKLTMADLHVNPYEFVYATPGACGWDAQIRQNDDNDPFNFNWAGFNFDDAGRFKQDLLDHEPQVTNYMLRGGVNTRFQDLWLNDLRASNYNLYLQEAIEDAIAPLVYWRKTYGVVPKWHQPFNEPLTGNNEVFGGNTQEIVDLTKTMCARLQREGFTTTKLAVPSETDEASSLSTAQAILADPQARACVGAITYHPYGGGYAPVDGVLGNSGIGQPNPNLIAVRNQIRDLARQYGLQVWMTEVSGGRGSNTFDWARARAIHIHDELIYGDANAFWGMWNAGPTSDPVNYDADTVVTFAPGGGSFSITAMGRAIGHYARRVAPGSVRIEASSGDPLVQVTAFKNDATAKLSFVIINNNSSSASVTVNLAGASLSGALSGEQSTAAAFWQAIPPITPSAASFTITLPALSITSVGD
jgi:O-glycosyl hydrolase